MLDEVASNNAWLNWKPRSVAGKGLFEMRARIGDEQSHVKNTIWASSPEQVRMVAGAGKDKIVAVDLVEKQLVRLDVAIAISNRLSGESFRRGGSGSAAIRVNTSHNFDRSLPRSRIKRMSAEKYNPEKKTYTHTSSCPMAGCQPEIGNACGAGDAEQGPHQLSSGEDASS
jgi:hypothetical protein